MTFYAITAFLFAYIYIYIKPETFDNRITKDNYENFFYHRQDIRGTSSCPRIDTPCFAVYPPFDPVSKEEKRDRGKERERKRRKKRVHTRKKGERERERKSLLPRERNIKRFWNYIIGPSPINPCCVLRRVHCPGVQTTYHPCFSKRKNRGTRASQT